MNKKGKYTEKYTEEQRQWDATNVMLHAKTQVSLGRVFMARTAGSEKIQNRC